MNRRGFLSAMLAAGVAPAIVRASSLMPVIVRAESPLYLVQWGPSTEEVWGASPALRNVTATEILHRMEQSNAILRDMNARFIERLINPPLTFEGKVITFDHHPLDYWKNAR